jgi:predicted phage tail protein
MSPKIFYLLALLAGFSLASCDDLIEPDISDEQVRLLVPVDSAVVRTAAVVFRWEEVSRARRYRLQVASPSFAKPTQVYIDTFSVSPSLSLPLQPGQYEWRVQALNAGYETDFASLGFTLDSASNLTGAELRLRSPANNASTSNPTVLFSWEQVELADKYILEIEGGAKLDSVVYATSVRKTFPRQGRTYQWRVRALNATGIVTSPWRKFTTDFEAPASPGLLFPRADTTVFTWPVELKWRRNAEDVAGDSLFLYLTDQNKTVSGFPKMVTTPYFSLPPSLSLAPGDYFWAVKSIDRAGNVSILTDKRRFTVR